MSPACNSQKAASPTADPVMRTSICRPSRSMARCSETFQGTLAPKASARSQLMRNSMVARLGALLSPDNLFGDFALKGVHGNTVADEINLYCFAAPILNLRRLERLTVR